SDLPATEAVLKQLAGARRPLLFLGNGSRRALADRGRRNRLVGFVRRFALPVMTPPEAKGPFPEKHDYALRTYGLAGSVWPKHYLLPPGDRNHYDALLVVGSSLQQHATSGWDEMLLPKGPFFQVDLDQAVIGRAFPIQGGIVAEAGVFLDDLCRQGESVQPDPKLVQDRDALLKQIKHQHPYPYIDR